MSISEKKQSLSGGGEKKASKDASSLEKDGSVFSGKAEIPRETLWQTLRDPRLFNKTNLPERERLVLGKELFKPYGSYLDKKELTTIESQLESGKWGKFKNMPPETRKKASRLVKALLKK